MERRNKFHHAYNTSCPIGTTRYKRIYPPAHYEFKIESLSLLVDTKVESYDSDVFESGDLTWRLRFYPDGDKKRNGANHISLYLTLEDAHTLPPRWEVDVEFKLFVYDQNKNDYLVVQDVKDGGVKRFHQIKTEWGFAQFLSLQSFKFPSNGYLVNDSCVFGAEVFVIQPCCKWESVSMVKQPRNGSLTWKIVKFSQLPDKALYSNELTAGGRTWRLLLYPKGCGAAKGDSLSVYLELVNGRNLPSKKKVWVEYKLQVLDQRQGKNVEKTVKHWFTSSISIFGYSNFMPLGDLYQGSKGFVMNDVLIVEVKFLVMSVTKLFS